MRKNKEESLPDFKPSLLLEPFPQDRRVAQWYSSGLVGELNVMVNSEVFRKAEALLHANSRPTRGTLRSSEENSLNHAWSAGYADAFADLRNLSRNPNTSHQKLSSNAEWNHVT